MWRSMVTAAGVGLLLLSSQFYSVSAFAQSAICGKRLEIVQLLKERYGETLNREQTELVAIPSAEVYVSPSGTWSIVVEVDAKMHCIISAGHLLKDKPEALKRKSA